jgi:prepilin-type N-terminal cleavage/methylation domain-containing protein
MSCRGRSAFTLIELMVVVSIIALLISILLPSLKAARESAKVVVCSSTLKGLTGSNAIYQSLFNEWLAGAPGTSGSALIRHRNNDTWGPADTVLTIEAGDEDATMAQWFDWATPLEVVDDPPVNRPAYYKLLFERNSCPSNQFRARPVIGMGGSAGAAWPATQAPSYYTVRQMLVWPNSSRSAPYDQAKAGGPNGAGCGGEGPGDGWELPAGYAPNLSRLGNPARKIFLTDGSRWTDPISGSITYNVEWNARSGGAFSTGGAALRYADEDADDSWLRDFFLSTNPDTMRTAPVTYRHKRGKKIGVSVVFYDGHAAYLSEDESRHPDYWWPKGTRVNWRGELNQPAMRLVKDYKDSDGYYTCQ